MFLINFDGKDYYDKFIMQLHYTVGCIVSHIMIYMTSHLFIEVWYLLNEEYHLQHIPPLLM